jgi:hypothetical protein
MTEETDLGSDLTADKDDASFDPERDLVEYERDTLDADDLYDVRHEAENIGAVALAARIEIERRNLLAYDDYQAQFGQHELLDIGMALMSAKQRRFQTNESERVQRIQDLAASFLDGFDLDQEDFGVEMVDEPPTVDEMKDE